MTRAAPALALVALLAGPARSGEPPAPTRSLPRAGAAAVGQASPWFAGWTLAGRGLNRDKLLAGLARHKPPGRGLLISVFATWCTACEAGLRALAANRERLWGRRA